MDPTPHHHSLELHRVVEAPIHSPSMNAAPVGWDHANQRASFMESVAASHPVSHHDSHAPVASVHQAPAHTAPTNSTPMYWDHREQHDIVSDSTPRQTTFHRPEQSDLSAWSTVQRAPSFSNATTADSARTQPSTVSMSPRTRGRSRPRFDGASTAAGDVNR